MGEEVTRFCDFCKTDVDTGFGPHIYLFGVDIKVIEYTSTVWGNPEYRLGFKGELCGDCRTRLIEALCRAYHHTHAECKGEAPVPTATALWKDKKKLRAKPGAKRGSRG